MFFTRKKRIEEHNNNEIFSGNENYTKKNRIGTREIITMIGISLVLIMGALFVYKTAVKLAMNGTQKITIEDRMTATKRIRLEEPIYQNISYSEGLVGIELPFTTYAKVNTHGTIIAQIIDKSTESILSQCEILAKNIDDGALITFVFSQEVDWQSEGEYLLKLQAGREYDSTVYLGVYYYSQNSEIVKSENSLYFYVGTNKYQGRLNMGTVNRMIGLQKLYALLVIFIIFIALLIYLLIIFNAKIHTLFFVSCLLLGIIYWFVVPPLATFDEHLHLENTLYHASEIINPAYVQDDAITIPADYDYKNSITEWRASPEKYLQFQHLFEKIQDNKQTTLKLTSNLLNPSYIYFAQTLGAVFSYLCGFNLLTTFFFAAIFNLIFYTLVIWGAIRIIPVYKEILFCLALSPSALKAAASLSYDAFINALSFLFIACVLNYRFSNRKIGLKDMIFLAIIIGLLAPCKLIYGALVFLLLLLPKESFASKSRKKLIVIVFISTAVSLAIFQGNNLLGLLNSKNDLLSNMGPWGNPAYTYFDIFRRPGDIIKLFVNTLLRDSGTIFIKGISRIQYIEYPLSLSLLMIVCILVLMFSSKEYEEIKLTKNDYLVITGVIVVMTFLLFVSSIAWTTVGSLTLMGVQGRYFIPLFPLLFFLLTGSIFKVKFVSRDRWKYLFIFIQIVGIAVILTNGLARQYDAIVAW